jgi:hypothetical protein
MACSGCQNRQEALNRMMQAARQKDLQRTARMGAYVVKSGVRDLRQVARASWDRVARRPQPH